MSNIIVPPYAEAVSYAVAVIVQERRLARGWSPARLAKLSGVTRQCIEQTEKHITAPKLPTAAAIAWALEVRVSELIAEAEQRLG